MPGFTDVCLHRFAGRRGESSPQALWSWWAVFVVDIAIVFVAAVVIAVVVDDVVKAIVFVVLHWKIIIVVLLLSSFSSRFWQLSSTPNQVSAQLTLVVGTQTKREHRSKFANTLLCRHKIWKYIVIPCHKTNRNHIYNNPCLVSRHLHVLTISLSRWPWGFLVSTSTTRFQ